MVSNNMSAPAQLPSGLIAMTFRNPPDTPDTSISQTHAAPSHRSALGVPDSARTAATGVAASATSTPNTSPALNASASKPDPKKIRVFLVDDHEVVRRGVMEMLNSEPDIEVVGEAATVSQALVRALALQPNVAVLDVKLPDGSGVEVCRQLRAKIPNIACLMLTSFADDDALVEAIVAGAAGYILKQVRGNELVKAVRTVATGESLLDPITTTKLLDRLRADATRKDPFAGLSEQERKILELIAEGLTNRQIGEELFLAEKTVKNYVSNLLAKLGLERRTQAAVYVVQARQQNQIPGRRH